MKHAFFYYTVTSGNKTANGNELYSYEDNQILSPASITRVVDSICDAYLNKNWVEPQVVIKNIMYLQ